MVNSEFSSFFASRLQDCGCLQKGPLPRSCLSKSSRKMVQSQLECIYRYNLPSLSEYLPSAWVYFFPEVVLPLIVNRFLRFLSLYCIFQTVSCIFIKLPANLRRQFIDIEIKFLPLHISALLHNIQDPFQVLWLNFLNILTLWFFSI